MFNDIDWTRKGNEGICVSNSEKIKEYAKRFSQGHWTFLNTGNEKRDMELFFTQLKENGILLPLKWLKVSKIRGIQHSRVSVL